MTLFIVYLFKLLLNFFVTTILVTDLNSEESKKTNNLTLYFFISFFSLTIVSLANILVNDNLFFGFALVIIFFVINSLSKNKEDSLKIKFYLISLCSILFGYGSFASIMIGFISALVSYIIIYNSSDFYSFFFSFDNNDNTEKIKKDN